MFSVNHIFLLNITYAFAFITCLGFLVIEGTVLEGRSDDNDLFPLTLEIRDLQSLKPANFLFDIYSH